jgi:hypothetical protein
MNPEILNHLDAYLSRDKKIDAVCQHFVAVHGESLKRFLPFYIDNSLVFFESLQLALN